MNRARPVRVGLTLPSFVEDPDIPIAVAHAAEEAGLDAVFVFDHLWRGDPPNRRPALECFSLLGAVAAETTRIQVGTLVARATLRPSATLANCLRTAQRVSDGPPQVMEPRIRLPDGRVARHELRELLGLVVGRQAVGLEHPVHVDWLELDLGVRRVEPGPRELPLRHREVQRLFPWPLAWH